MQSWLTLLSTHIVLKLLLVFILALQGDGYSTNHPKVQIETTRRESMQQILLSLGTGVTFISPLSPRMALAKETDENLKTIERENDGKPFAPAEALLPAARLKLWTDKSYKTSLTFSSADKEKNYETILELNKILSSPPKLFINEKMLKRSSSSTAQITSPVSSANKDQYQMNRRGLNVGDKFSAMLNQADVERQWGMLQYAESKREESNEMRAALNFYTQQLNFGDKYNLTASKEERKRMIRNDELPSLSAVITSDLDLRDLYRNQFLTAIEDVQAEVAYQAKQTANSVEVSDTIDLIRQAHKALSQWFDLISPQDVQVALESVTLMQNQ